MQGQKGYVNGYVVIIFSHYINCCGDGRMRENVTWASFFVRWVVVGVMAKSAQSSHIFDLKFAYCPNRSASRGNNRSHDASIFTCNSSSPRVLPRLMAITGLPCSTIALHRRNAE
ncbi:hypothetical protein [Pseudomonas sp. 58 R 3]|nr:hypothetical protein [Pseudomonas sp. 58 R 3]